MRKVRHSTYDGHAEPAAPRLPFKMPLLMSDVRCQMSGVSCGVYYSGSDHHDRIQTGNLQPTNYFLKMEICLGSVESTVWII